MSKVEMNPQVRRYLRRVRRWLPCSWRMKNRIMENIQANLEVFLEEHPDTNLSQLDEQFGIPQQIAATYIENVGTAELLRNLRVRRRIVGIVAGCAALIFAIWLGSVLWLTADAYNSIHGAITRSVTEFEP